MPARVIVVRGYNRGEFFALEDDETLYLVLEEVEDKKSEVSVRRLAPKEERVAKLESRAAELHVSNVLPDGGTIAINGERRLKPGDTITLGHGDAISVRDAVVRIETDLSTADEVKVPAGVAEKAERAARKARRKRRTKKPGSERAAAADAAPKAPEPELDVSITIAGGEAGDEPGSIDADSAVVEAPTATLDEAVESHIVSHEPAEESGNFDRLVGTTSPGRLRRYIQTIQLVGTAALVSQDMKALMTRTLEIVGGEFPTASGAILWRVPGRDTFRVLARVRHESATPHLSRTVLRHVLEKGEAVLSLDTTEDSRLQKADSLSGKPMRSVLSVPVIRLGRVVGVVQFDDKGVGKFDEAHLALVSAVAGSIASGVVALEGRNNQLKVQAARGVGQALRDVVMSSALASDLAHAGVEVSTGFLGEAMSVGVFATVLLRGEGGPATRVIAAVGDLGVSIPKSPIAAFAAQSAFAALAHEDVPLERIAAALDRTLAEASLPPPRSAVLAMFDPAEGALEVLRRGADTPVLHHVASDGHVEAPEVAGEPATGSSWQAISMRLEPGDTALLASSGLLRALGGLEDLSETFEFEADEGDVAEVLDGVLELANEKGEPSVHRSGVILMKRTEGVSAPAEGGGERRGWRSAMPDAASAARFRVSLCFFRNASDERPTELDPGKFSLRSFIADHDAELWALLGAAGAELRASKWGVYLGDPDEDLEEAIEAHEARAGAELPLSGFVVLNGCRMKEADPTELEPEPGLANAPALRTLFAAVRERYGAPSELGAP